MLSIHPNARTTPAVRAEIARSHERSGVLAQRYGVSAETIRKWRKRGPADCQDRSALGHKARARMGPAYVAGLIGIGERKSIQPMALRDGGVGYDQLHHFVGAGVWDAAPLERELARQADATLGGDEAFLIVDDTALPKKGAHSVGVAPQYASALGKNANCQTLVSLTLASCEVPAMVGLRLFLPESWTGDEARLARAGVPEHRRTYRTKPEIAIEEIDRLRAAGVRFGCVLADAGYGLSAPFRQALSDRGLPWAVGIPRTQKVYPSDVAMIFPVAGRGRPRKNPVPDVISVPVQAMLESARWRKLSWRRGVKGRLAARFAAIRVRVADGTPGGIGAVAKKGDTMGGHLTSVVIPHGTLGAVTENYAYINTSTNSTPNGGNTHSVTVAASSGTHTINPTGLVEGGTMRINMTWQSGAWVINGVDEWIQGNGDRSTTFGGLGTSALVANRTYFISLFKTGAGKVIGSYA